MAESEEALQLKRRARRRLVGAIALVTFVVIILPLILDKAPGPAGPPLSVQIPSQDAGSFNARIASPAPQLPAATGPEKKPRSLPAEPCRAANAALSFAKVEPAEVHEAANAPAPPADKAGQALAHAVLNDQAWVVSLDAFSDKKNVTQLRSKLTAAGVKSYTEPVKTSKGELTRVRAGPFASKEAAEKARSRLAAMGLKPGAVASR